MDRNRFNFQITNKVAAAVFSTTADREILEFHVTIHNNPTKAFQYVSTMDPNVEPCPSFYSYGTRGWHSKL